MLEDANVRVLAVAMLEATYDEELATAVQRNLTALRSQLGEVARASGVPKRQTSGVVTTLAALLDGILIHCLLDPETDIRGAAAAAKRISFR